MTKKQIAKQQKATWNQALTDGRVVRFDADSPYWRSFLTVEAARNAINVASVAGIKAEIVALPPNAR